MARSAPSKKHQSKPSSTTSDASSQPSSSHTTVSDPRFAALQSDPRYRPPSKRHAQIKVDKRFSHMLKDEDFARKAKVDRWGRRLETDAERKRLKRKYRFDDEDQEDGVDDDEVVRRELERVEEKDQKGRDRIRGVGQDADIESGNESSSVDDSSSSSDEDEEEEGDVEEEEEIGQTSKDGVPLGEVSSRIAVVNLDWDHIRAEDLMVVFSSFVPAGGKLNEVVIYPSEFGRERMEREEMEGPPQELFSSKAHDTNISEDGASDGEDDEEAIKESIIKPDAGEEFNSARLRKYQLERLRYFYAVLIFSSPTIAKAVYDAVDGTEYLSTANFFDLRFVPDETDFSSDLPREHCNKMPEGYKPNEFVTDALQHSKVKLTWDADDPARKDAQAKAFRGSRKDIEENDLKAYLGSDSSDEEDEVVAEGVTESQSDTKASKKEKEKQRLRALLGLGDAPSKKLSVDGPVGGVQITFSAGLSEGDKKASVFANDPEPEETTMAKYVRKERERKQKRKEKLKARHDGDEVPEEVEVAERDEPVEDLGFDDPFFTAPENDKASAAALRKQEKKKKREERAHEEEAAAAKRAELELLMVDDKEANVKHFDMNEIERAEKKKKKGKKGKKNDFQDETAAVDSFEMDVTDPRFAQLYENHEFAIDPTNSKFKGTKGMSALLEEGRKRRRLDGADEVERLRKANSKRKASNDKANEVGSNNEDFSKLIRSVKARSKGAQ